MCLWGYCVPIKEHSSHVCISYVRVVPIHLFTNITSPHAVACACRLYELKGLALEPKIQSAVLHNCACCHVHVILMFVIPFLSWVAVSVYGPFLVFYACSCSLPTFCRLVEALLSFGLDITYLICKT